MAREISPRENVIEANKEDQERRERLDAVFSNLPEIQAGHDLWQNNFHEFDVFDHTVECVKEIAKLSADDHMRVAAWLHDIGKPVVAEPKLDKDGQPLERQPGQPYHTFPEHEVVGEEMVKKLDQKLFAEFALDQEKVASLVGCHFLPMRGVKALRKTTNFADFTAAFKRLDETLSAASISKEEILDMFVADSLAKGKNCTDQPDLLAVRDALVKGKPTEEDLRRAYEIQKEIHRNKE